MDNISATKVLNGKNSVVDYVKSKAFDVIGIVIILAMSLLSLGFVELRSLNWKEFSNIVIECVPLYLAAMLLSVNYYNKGAFAGKHSDKFKDAIEAYSEIVSNITGEALSSLHSFCIHYNDKALKNLRIVILRSAAITYEMYDAGDTDTLPLKTLSKKQLKKKYGKIVCKAVLKCNSLKIKGINVSTIMSELDTNDVTDLGYNESQMKKVNIFKYAGSYMMTVLLMSFIGVKDVMLWGWMGALLTLFKVLYIAAGAYMKYFNGFEDVTCRLTNHFYRKTDVAKEFLYWLKCETLPKDAAVTK